MLIAHVIQSIPEATCDQTWYGVKICPVCDNA